MATASDRSTDPLEQLLDMFVYAPIGLVVQGSESFPELVEKGRARAQTARVVGTFALGASNSRVRDALGQVESHLGEFLRIVATAASGSPAGTTGRATPGSTSPSPNPGDAGNADAPTGVDDLVPGYDDLSARVVIPMLAGLDPDALDRIAAHERGHRARKTVLHRLQQLRG